MLLGCATEPPISEARWRAQKEYEQQWARDDGRIGYIGNAGATAGGELRARANCPLYSTEIGRQHDVT
jgi:hypothetical protein